jgi:hypothetical protein
LSLLSKEEILVVDVIVSEGIKVIKAGECPSRILKMIKTLNKELKNIGQMSMVTHNKILNLLNSFSHPGGPYFPPRKLRTVCKRIAFEMFPEGRIYRWLTHTVFSLMHPFQVSKSVAFHTYNTITEGFKYCVAGCCKRG